MISAGLHGTLLTFMVMQAEILELERGEEAARDPNAVITQAGRYRIRTASNGDSAILL